MATLTNIDTPSTLPRTVTLTAVLDPLAISVKVYRKDSSIFLLYNVYLQTVQILFVKKNQHLLSVMQLY